MTLTTFDTTLARMAIALIAIALVANLSVSTAIVRSESLNAFEKTLRVCVVWLVPILGSLLVGVFMDVAKAKSAPNKTADAKPAVALNPGAAYISIRFRNRRKRNPLCHPGAVCVL